MIFDESFSRLDDGRLAGMLRLLGRENGQTVILTSNGREQDVLKEQGIQYNEVRI